MAIHYYDDLITEKLRKWLPESTTLRILHPDESKRFFELTAEDRREQAFQLPLIALSRRDELELLSTVKSPKSYDGLRLIPLNTPESLEDLKGDAYTKAIGALPAGIFTYNVLPIRPEYQLDIYTKTAEECEEYVRNFLFKLINNPMMRIEIPYNDLKIEHTTYLRILPNIANTSAVAERLFSGQFTRWTIQFELQDAFLFSIPYKKNWRITDSEVEASEAL